MYCLFQMRKPLKRFLARPVGSPPPTPVELTTPPPPPRPPGGVSANSRTSVWAGPSVRLCRISVGYGGGRGDGGGSVANDRNAHWGVGALRRGNARLG